MPLYFGRIAVSSHAVGVWKGEAKEGILIHLLLFLLSIQFSEAVSEIAQERISASRYMVVKPGPFAFLCMEATCEMAFRKTNVV